ncbi:KilA-N domain-containing protein [Cyclobacterium sp. SYSU L10401]|uniref:KilA-N domain-containing protein n=1 Tax=Cyclobacterium sp. SYSU L10401 TaxID=2678657 RepID=UPI0013D051FE|nr:KilA-N domain-containing protein [Cyclobacterium sp. SYSU L10401]
MAKNKKITIEGAEITVLSQEADDYISQTDMARSGMQNVVVIKWLSLKSTIEYLGEWESLYNPDFNYTEFGTIKNANQMAITQIKSLLKHKDQTKKLNT